MRMTDTAPQPKAPSTIRTVLSGLEGTAASAAPPEEKHPLSAISLGKLPAFHHCQSARIGYCAIAIICPSAAVKYALSTVGHRPIAVSCPPDAIGPSSDCVSAPFEADRGGQKLQKNKSTKLPLALRTTSQHFCSLTCGPSQC